MTDFGGIVIDQTASTSLPYFHWKSGESEMRCPSCDVVMQSSALWPVYREQTLSQASPLTVNNPIFDLWFLFQTLMNEAARGKRGFISDLHSHFNLENQSGAGEARWWAADVPGCLSKQSSASASSVYVSPSTVHLPLSFHACVTIFRAGLLWKLHSVCAQWIKITQHTGNYSLGHPVICFSDGIAGRATVPPSGHTKPGYCLQSYNHTYHDQTHLLVDFHLKYHQLKLTI